MSREALLVRTLVELADNLVEDFDVIDVLTVLSDRCVEVLDVDSAGVMLASPGGELQVVASSSDTMRGLELFELQANEGPCVDCFRERRAIVNLELSAVDARWPRFARRAVADGFHSVHALPMHLRGTHRRRAQHVPDRAGLAPGPTTSWSPRRSPTWPPSPSSSTRRR